MYKKLFLCQLLIANCLFASAQSYKKLHFNAIFVDTHNDLLSTAIEKNYIIDTDLSGKTHSDLDRFKKGGVDVQLFSIWCDGLQAKPYAWASREMDTLDAVAKRNPRKIKIVHNTAELLQAVKGKKISRHFWG